MGELRIDRGIGLVSPRRHIKIMQRDQSGTGGSQCDGDMARIAFFTKWAPVNKLEGNFRGDRNPMVAFLTVDRDVRVAKLMKNGQRKFAVPALRLLKTENVRRRFAQEASDKINPQSNRVDIPSGKSETHARLRRLATRPVDHAQSLAASVIPEVCTTTVNTGLALPAVAPASQSRLRGHGRVVKNATGSYAHFSMGAASWYPSSVTRC